MKKKELKYIGKENEYKERHWVTDDKSLLKRAFESVFGTGLDVKRIDKTKISRLHLEILRSLGYVKDIPNIGVSILTDKAFADKDKILCAKN